MDFVTKRLKKTTTIYIFYIQREWSGFYNSMQLHVNFNYTEEREN